MAIDWNDRLTIDDDTLTISEWLRLWDSMEWPVSAIADKLREKGLTVSDNAVAIKRTRLKQAAHEPTTADDDTVEDGTVIEHTSPHHLTPEAVIEELGLSLDDWIIVSFRVNEWTSAPNASKNLVAEGGRWAGTVQRKDDDAQHWAYSITVKPKVVVAPDVSFRFIQAQPHESVPAIPRATGTIRNALIFGDSQIGFTGSKTYHDRAALDVIVQIAQNAGHSSTGGYLDEVICVGDYLDLDCWQNRFVHDPDALGATQRTVCEGWYWWWRIAEAVPTARRVLLEGNHDARMGLSVSGHLREACGLRSVRDMASWPVLSIPYLLDLDKLKVEYMRGYPHNVLWLTDWLKVIHGTAFSSAPGQTARKLLQNTDTNTVAGHSHRNERASRTIHTRHGQQEITAVVVGCACKIDGTVPGRSATPQWQQGALWVTYDTEDPSRIEFQEIRIHDGSAMFRGKVYTGRPGVVQHDLCNIFAEVKW